MQVVFDHPLLWQWANVLFISGSIITILGLALLTGLLREAGDRVFSLLGQLAFVFGVLFWVSIVAFRQSIDPWSAQELVRTSALPDFYIPLTLWMRALGVISTVLAFAALAAFSGSILSTAVLPRWVGWFTLLYSLSSLLIFALTHDLPPLLYYLPSLLMGIMLLL